MLMSAIVAFFRYKAVRSVIIIACCRPLEQIQLLRAVSALGLPGAVVCEPAALGAARAGAGLRGVLYVTQHDYTHLAQMSPDNFSSQFVWLMVSDAAPLALSGARYDAHVTRLTIADNHTAEAYYSFLDVYIHPGSGVSEYPWGSYSPRGELRVTGESARIRRRLHLNGFPLRIAAPVGQYSEARYAGSYQQFVEDDSLPELDAGIRCAYAASSMIIQRLHATQELVLVELWGSTVHESSMPLQLARGGAELSGGVLRMLPDRAAMLDYLIPIWPFHVGFTYLAERESSSNMFVAPFSRGVWLLAPPTAALLALALRLAARTPHERDAALTAVLATFLQQDAGCVPGGAAARVTFTVVSGCAMLLHAYYTSAVVSALMAAGGGGPTSLPELADSAYRVASEDYEYMRYLFFDVETNWEELEYLKRKKKTATFYQPLERGVELVRAGGTAFHTEYNQIYPHFRTFSDEQICKIQHVDTIPEVATWVTTRRGGALAGSLRAAGAWLLEAGLVRRGELRARAPRPACRAQLLAQRVRFGDVAPLVALCCAGAALAALLLAAELLAARRHSAAPALLAGGEPRAAGDIE